MKLSVYRFLILILLFFSSSEVMARMPMTLTDETPRKYWQFLFLYESTTAPGQEEVIYRLPLPFYGRYSNAERGYTFHHILYPIFYSHGTNHWKKWSFLYLFQGDSKYRADQGRESDTLLAPLLFWGRGENSQEKYFGFFPFYGRFKDKLAHSEISFFLFPFGYTGWSHKNGYRAHSILWPFFMWGSGPKRSDLRIFPFYSRKVHEGKYRKYSVLWPIVQWGTEGLDKLEPRSYLYVWPFYARKWSKHGNLNVHGILPILFMPLASWGSDKKTGTYNLNILWFLYQYGYSKTPKIRKHIFFPFYGRYQFAHKEFTFITPLYANVKNHTNLFEGNTTVLFPFYWNSERYYLKDWTKKKSLKLWPLFNYVKDNRGNMMFNSLTLLPFNWEGFDRIWGPLYGLVEYRRFENGDRYFSLMFRLYSQYWNPRELHLFVLGFEYHKTPEYLSVEFLGGLLGFRHNYMSEDGKKDKNMRSNYVKLFWYEI